MGDGEPGAAATVRGTRKRLRGKPRGKARKVGAYIPQGTDVHVLQMTAKWALVLLPGGAAGWMKRANLTPEEGSDEDE